MLIRPSNKGLLGHIYKANASVQTTDKTSHHSPIFFQTHLPSGRKACIVLCKLIYTGLSGLSEIRSFVLSELFPAMLIWTLPFRYRYQTRHSPNCLQEFRFWQVKSDVKGGFLPSVITPRLPKESCPGWVVQLHGQVAGLYTGCHLG